MMHVTEDQVRKAIRAALKPLWNKLPPDQGLDSVELSVDGANRLMDRVVRQLQAAGTGQAPSKMVKITGEISECPKCHTEWPEPVEPGESFDFLLECTGCGHRLIDLVPTKTGIGTSEPADLRQTVEEHEETLMWLLGELDALESQLEDHEGRKFDIPMLFRRVNHLEKRLDRQSQAINQEET